MARPSLEAYFLVPCRAAVWNGPPGPNTSRTLEDVAYIYRKEPADEFPHETAFWLFTRLAHDGTCTFARELFVTLIWHDDPQQRRSVCTRPFQVVTFRPAVVVRDVAASFSAVFEGPGRYEFRLWYRVVRKWDQKRGRRTLARAHIRIED